MAKTTTTERDDRFSRLTDRTFHLIENVVYALAGLALVSGALIVLVSAGWHLVRDLDDGSQVAVTTALDALLLVFILLELLAGVRATMVERKLVAEPFLVVGIIASIKEIIVVALEAKDLRGDEGEGFDHAITEIGVLGVLILLLAAATYLVRRKEREPEE